MKLTRRLTRAEFLELKVGDIVRGGYGEQLWAVVETTDQLPRNHNWPSTTRVIIHLKRLGKESENYGSWLGEDMHARFGRVSD